MERYKHHMLKSIVSSMSIASVGAYVGLTEFITNLFVPMLAELSPTAISF